MHYNIESATSASFQLAEARAGFEPANEGFADLAINRSGTAPFLSLEVFVCYHKTMQKIQTFFRTFLKSTTSPAYYADVLRARFGFSFKYFLFFNFMLALITVARIAVPLSLFNISNTVDQVSQIYPPDLAITIDNARLSINKPLPYIIPMPSDMNFSARRKATLGEDALVVFDTDARVQGPKDVPKYHAAMVVTETTMYVRGSGSNPNEIRSYLVPANPEPVTFDESSIGMLKQQFLNMPFIKYKWYIPAILVAAFIVIFPLVWLFRLITVMIYSLISFILGKIFRSSMLHDREFSYNEVMQLSLHTMTPLILAAYLIDLVTPGHIFHGWLFFLAYLIVTLFVMNQASEILVAMSKKTKTVVKPAPKAKAKPKAKSKR